MKNAILKTPPSLVKISLLTAGAVILSQVLNRLVVYHMFRFEGYLSLVAAAFFIAGYFLRYDPGKTVVIPGPVDTRVAGQRNAYYNLTNRELSIFRLLAEGKTNKEIAAEFCVELSTVKTHINNLYVKIGCKNRVESRRLWDEMVQNGIIS